MTAITSTDTPRHIWDSSSPIALLPGIDMCNHAGGGKELAGWLPLETTADVYASRRGGVELRRIAGRGGGEQAEVTEVTISYGDKPGEEFLFLYGFLPYDNPDDMVVLPLPPITQLGPSNRCANILASFAPFGWATI